MWRFPLEMSGGGGIVARKEIGRVSPTKEQVLNMVRNLPDDVTIDDILAEIFFKAQVDEGLKELDEGQGIPHEEVEKRMSRWLVR